MGPLFKRMERSQPKDANHFDSRNVDPYFLFDITQFNLKKGIGEIEYAPLNLSNTF